MTQTETILKKRYLNQDIPPIRKYILVQLKDSKSKVELMYEGDCFYDNEYDRTYELDRIECWYEELEVPVAGVTDEETIGQQNLLLEDINTLFNDLETGECEISDGRNIAIKMIQSAFKLAVSGNKPGKVDLKKVSMNIVSQLFDLSGISVDERQYLNDTADRFVLKVLENLTSTPADTLDKEELLKQGMVQFGFWTAKNDWQILSHHEDLWGEFKFGTIKRTLSTKQLYEEYLRLCTK